ncbi:brain acid soluble protein 1 [Rhipicephalus sanguineus]|uniref:brain acid soluble protein 1 n=1 Tax=Rhipicephalus sanguineus TaxID=34632 RepID=UPI00189492F7|nr:brain acid soluble protein 1 [Rhipicephalus sanguineus]
MPKKQEDGKEDPPKTVREKRQSAAAADNAPGPSNEAPDAKRPRGRPPKALSVEPRAPKPIASTEARKLRKADAAQPENEGHSTSREVPSKATRAIRKKRSRSRSPSSANETESEAPRHRSAKRRSTRSTVSQPCSTFCKLR